MSRWWLAIGLLLSVGVNVGILAAVTSRRLGSRPSETPGPPVETPPELTVPGNPGDPLARVSGLADRLELEGDRRREFLDLHIKLFQDLLRLRAERGEVQRELRRAVTAEKPDTARIDQLLAESARINLGLERTTVQSVLAVRKLLSDEDQQKYLQLIARLRPAGPGGLMNEGQPLRPADLPPALRQKLQEERLRRWRDDPRGMPPPGERPRPRRRPPE